jgi:hypothetical protein
VRSVADPGCSYRIPDPNFSIPDPGSKRSRIRIRIKEFKYFNPEKCFQVRGKFTRDVHPDPDFLPIPDPGAKNHLISDPDPQL